MTRPVPVFLALALLLGAGGGCARADRVGARPCPSVSTASPPPPTAPAGTTPPCVVAETSEAGATTTTGGGGYNFELTQPNPDAGGTQIMTADLDISLTVEAGQVTGTVEGPNRQKLTQPSCPSDTVTDGRTTAMVEGSLTDKVLRLRVVSATWRRPVVQPCPEGGTPGLLGEGSASGIYGFGESLSRLDRADDGAYRYDHTEVVDAPGQPFTVDYHVVVRFAA